MDAVAFDLDGVLVDVGASFRACIPLTVAALGGHPAPDAAVQALKNGGGFNNDWDVTRELLRQQGIEVARERVVEAFSRIYRGAPGSGVYGPEGLIHRERWLLPADLLTALAERFRLAVFTGRPRADAEFTLRRHQALASMAEVIALEDAAAKPHPDGLLQLTQRWGRLRAYVGDTIDDARCAAAAGVPFVGVCRPGSELERLFAAAGAQCIAASVVEAAAWLLAD
jgi:HAD superfamily hydrolase (TIGR01548 family)